jgi:hypothetical protein
MPSAPASEYEPEQVRRIADAVEDTTWVYNTCICARIKYRTGNACRAADRTEQDGIHTDPGCPLAAAARHG